MPEKGTCCALFPILLIEVTMKYIKNTITFNDNCRSAHPKVIADLNELNESIKGCGLPSYGEDVVTENACNILKDHFGINTKTFFVPTGTAANTIALEGIVGPTESIICSDRSHINVDECGSVHKLIGCSIKPIKTTNGKIDANSIIELAKDTHGVGPYHHTVPKCVSITQPTEIGTVYTLKELKEICEAAKSCGLIVHMDGARLPNACVHLNCSLADTTSEIGVDILSL